MLSGVEGVTGTDADRAMAGDAAGAEDDDDEEEDDDEEDEDEEDNEAPGCFLLFLSR
jgi:ribosomal protein L12E/L44/L45/RPP1/RPP2